MLRWGPSNCRAGALALLAFAGLATFKLIAHPLLTAYAEVSLRIEHSQVLLSRYRALSGQRARLSARLETVKNAVSDSIAYLKVGPSETLAGATLQNHVRSIVEGAGGVLRSSQILPLEHIHSNLSVSRVGLRLEVQFAVGRLQDIVYSLEMTPPSVFIKEITILTGKAGELGGEAGANPTLDVRMEVYGLAVK